MNNRIGFALPLTMLLLASLACNFPKLRAPEKALQAVEGVSTRQESALAAVIENSPAVSSTASDDPGSTELILHWHGSLPGDPSTCHDLEVTGDHQARYGLCGSELQVAAFNPPQWDEMLLRNASFVISTPEVRVTFRGQGNIGGPAWDRAVVNWAQAAYASLYTGHTCAACSTVFNWSFGEEPGVSEAEACLNLWVTDYGYAYLGGAPCQGGQAVIKARGWLETGELAQLDAWLMSRAEVRLGETGASYLLGSGSQPMSEDEISQLAAWSQQVKNRLAAAGKKGQD